MANCSAVSGPSGSGCCSEPIVLTADGSRGIWASTSASASHHHWASRRASSERRQVDVAEQPDQRVRGDRQQGQVEQRAPRDAAQPDQGLVGRAEQRPQAAAHVVELDVGRAERDAHLRRHRRLLDVRQHLQQVVVAERGLGGGGWRAPRRSAAVTAPAPGRGPAAGRPERGLGHRRRREVTEPDRAVVADDDAIEVDAAVGDPGVVEPVELGPQAGDGAVVDRRSRARCARARPAAATPSGRTTTRASPRPALPAVTRWGTRTPARSASSVMNPSCSTSSSRLSRAVALGVAVPRQPPEVGQQLAVPGVAAVDLDGQRPVDVGTGRTGTCPRGRIDAGASSSTSRPRPSSASRMRDVVGRPPGEPTTMCTVAAASRPTAMAATPPVAVVAPRNSEPSNWSPMSHPAEAAERPAEVG